VLLALAALSVAGIMLLPTVYLLLRASGSGQALGEILLRPSTTGALIRTTTLAVSVTAASAVIAVPVAWLTVRTDLPGRRLWAVTAALPLVLPSYVVAYLVASVLGPRGLAQQLLYPLTGLERLPDIYGFPGALLVLTLMSYPFTLLTVRASLQRLDPSLEEAARSLGLTARQAFWRVTLPQLRPGLVAGSLLVALYVLRDFGAVTLMRYDTFARIIYVQYQSFASRDSAAAMALILVAMTAILLTFEMHLRGKATYSRRASGAAREAQVVRLGRWRWASLLLVGGVVTSALALPGAGLVYWLVRGLANGESLTAVWQPAWNSLSVSAGAALLTLGAAVPVALFAVRRPGRLSHLAERASYAGFALPGIVIALALVYFGVTYARSLYQTLAMLMLAYLILFLPQAVGATRASLLQVAPNLEEAARSLGHRPLGVLRAIIIPLVRPGLFAGAAMVFLTAMKELPAALILSPIGFRTLSTAVWTNVSEAFFARAALPALLLVLLSSVPLAIITLKDR
jgi:iron(III) transport system permease protein